MAVDMVKVLVRGLAILFALVVCAGSVSGQATRQMVQLAKDVYAMTGAGSNSAFVVTDDGVSWSTAISATMICRRFAR